MPMYGMQEFQKKIIQNMRELNEGIKTKKDEYQRMVVEM